VNRDETIAFIEKFRWIDKHEAFQNLMPPVVHTTDEQKDLLNEVLRKCCIDLLAIYRSKKTSVPKMQVRLILSHCMDEIARAKLTTDNKDFGYELCWYLSEKLGIDLKKSSYGKIWGYWKVIDQKVITVQFIRKAKASSSGSQ
jgi:hypothetical protein